MARGQDDAVGGHGLDSVRDDRSVAATEGLEKVSIGAEAEALSPRVVSGIEMWIMWDCWRELFDGCLFDGFSGLFRVGEAPFDDEDAEEDVLPAIQESG